MKVLKSRIQADIVRDYNNRYCLEHHKPRCLVLSIPKGRKKSAMEYMQSRATGEYKGACDLIVIHLGKVLFIQIKRPEDPKSSQTKAEKQFQQHVESCGYPYHIVRSLEDFNAILKDLPKP